MSANLPDFVSMKARFESESFPTSARAELRRVADLDAVSLCPGLYRLFPSQTPHESHRRLAFLVPCCKHDMKAKSLGAQLASAHVAEARVLQVARAKYPLDLVQLRRLLNHIEPAVNWLEFGKTIWYWGERAKRQLVEDFYLTQFNRIQGDK